MNNIIKRLLLVVKQWVLELLSSKQNITDDALETENKTIVGAINEVFSKAENGGGDNSYTKEEVDNNIEAISLVTAQSVYGLKEAIGAEEDFSMPFVTTTLFRGCHSIMDAFLILDEEVIPEQELYNILDALIHDRYGSGDVSGSAIGDFEEVEGDPETPTDPEGE